MSLSIATSPPLACLRRLKTSSLVPVDQKSWVTGLNWRRERKVTPLCSASPSQAPMEAEGWKEWLNKLPDKTEPMYLHSLPCIEAWLRSLGFYQSREDLSAWIIENPNWHARLYLDFTDIYIRYLKSGPGNLEKDVERKFSYALSREDIENAILGGP
ncbi:hypothetical protein FCM35_KLT15864 [Carex littledalei]|uniref:Uncharacterized protein n=1 Tax=Carex littledalei TaxID=544730 RepID=A0A833VXR3_9POAL|nr:hypothetical protein FCM35_KLT15864 [Carex littledalei]